MLPVFRPRAVPIGIGPAGLADRETLDGPLPRVRTRRHARSIVAHHTTSPTGHRRTLNAP